MLSTAAEIFAGFGPSKYLSRTPTSAMEVSSDYLAVHAGLRTACTSGPGVYGMVDSTGRLIYVGMSRNLRKRTQTYFQNSSVGQALPDASAHRKEARVASRARRMLWQPTGHELLALLREHELIQRFTPEMNVRGRQRRRLVYVYLSREDAPRFKVGPQLPKSCRHHWGPVPRNASLIRAIETLNRHFHLPDCLPDVPMRYRDQHNLFDLELHPFCLRGEMNRCLAPCAGVITRSKYVAQLNRVRAFLDGRDNSPLERLDLAIKQAVADRHFERAANLHQIGTGLADLRSQLTPRPDLLPTSFVYAIQRQSRTCWLAAHEGAVLKVASAPRTEQGRALWQKRFTLWRNMKLPLVDKREGSELQILSSWFRRNEGELNHVMDFDSALGGPALSDL